MHRTEFPYADGGDSHAIAFIAAVAVSVAVHVLLGWFARDARLALPGAPHGLSVEQRLALRRDSAMHVRRSAPAPSEARPAPETAEPPQRERARADSAPEEFLAAADTSSPAHLFAAPAPDPSGDPILAGVAPPEAVDAPPPAVQWQPRQAVMEISSRFANDDVAAIPRIEVPDIDRIAAAPDIAPETTVAAVMEAVAAGGAGGPPEKAWSPAPPPPGVVETPPSLLAPAGPDAGEPSPLPAEIAEQGASGTKAEAYFAEVPEDVAPAKPIENVLSASVKTFRPSADDGFVYFEVDVERKGEDVLPPVPRDIVFAVDASRSISPQHLAACREALSGALRAGLLGRSDRFEITAFNTTNAWAFGRSWREVSPESVSAASAFLDALRSDGNTDIYSAVRSVLSLPRSRGRATIAVMVSDGNATQGDVSRDSEIIGEFSRLNGGGVSVFTVGVSPKSSNEYLLSMLSFCNRGGPAAMPESRFAIPECFARALSAIGSPVLTDLRFVFDTSSGAVVTPKTTENLYLGKPLRLFGRAPLGTGKVVFQARGENGGRAYDMVFDLALGSPVPGSGDPKIAKDWARTRIYDLFAELARSSNPACAAEMSEIGRAHGVKVPFSNRLTGFDSTKTPKPQNRQK